MHKPLDPNLWQLLGVKIRDHINENPNTCYDKIVDMLDAANIKDVKLNHIYGRVRHCIRTGTADKWRRSALLHHNDCMPQERWNSLGRTMFFMTHDNPKLGDYDAVVKRCKKYTPDATEVDIERRYRVYLNQIALDKNPHYDWQVPF